jgi:phage terminase large subunit-like protein
MASNALYKQDSEGKIKPDKLKSRAPIDGLMALVTSLTVLVGLPDEREAQIFTFSDSELFGSDGNYESDDDW